MTFSFLILLCLAVAGPLLAQTPPAAKPKPAAPKTAPAKSTTPAAKKPAAAKSAATPAQGSGKVVLTVGSEKLTEKEFDDFVEALPEQYRQQARGAGKREVAEQLVRVKLLAQEARKRGLDKDKITQARIQFQVENLLAGSLFSDLQTKAALDPAEIKKYYDEHKSEYEQAQARHILIRFKGSPVPLREGQKELSEEEALAKTQELRKKLLAGGDFAALAKAESDDSGSGAQGGDLGTFRHGQMVPAFDEAAFKQPINEISQPIKTQFGYHLIRVDKRESKTLDEMRPDIEKTLRPALARKALEDMRKASNVVFDEAFFGPAAAPAEALPGATPPPAINK